MTTSINNKPNISKVKSALGESSQSKKKRKGKKNVGKRWEPKAKQEYKPAPPRRQLTGLGVGSQSLEARKKRIIDEKNKSTHPNVLEEHPSLEGCKDKAGEAFDNIYGNLEYDMSNDASRLNDEPSILKRLGDNMGSPKRIHFEQQDSSEIRDMVANSRGIREAESEPYVPNVGGREKMDSEVISKLQAKANELDDTCMIVEDMKKEEEFTLQKNITQGEVTINYVAEQVVKDGVIVKAKSLEVENGVIVEDGEELKAQVSEAKSWATLDSEISMDRMERFNSLVEETAINLKNNLNN